LQKKKAFPRNKIDNVNTAFGYKIIMCKKDRTENINKRKIIGLQQSGFFCVGGFCWPFLLIFEELNEHLIGFEDVMMKKNWCGVW